MNEYATGKELSTEQAKKEIEAGRVLTTLDGKERAILYRVRYATWQTEGKLMFVLNHLVDFTGWYIMERENWPAKEIATRENTDIRRLVKSFFQYV